MGLHSLNPRAFSFAMAALAAGATLFLSGDVHAQTATPRCPACEAGKVTGSATGGSLETRTWIRIDPNDDEIDRVAVQPRSEQSQARIEALIARHPSLADAGSPGPSR